MSLAYHFLQLDSALPFSQPQTSQKQPFSWRAFLNALLGPPVALSWALTINSPSCRLCSCSAGPVSGLGTSCDLSSIVILKLTLGGFSQMPPPGNPQPNLGTLTYSEHPSLPVQATHCVLPGLHRWTFSEYLLHAPQRQEVKMSTRWALRLCHTQAHV